MPNGIDKQHPQMKVFAYARLVQMMTYTTD